MFWIFLLITALAALLLKLGAASVMVSVLSIGLKAAVIVIAILGLILIWKTIFPKLIHINQTQKSQKL